MLISLLVISLLVYVSPLEAATDNEYCFIAPYVTSFQASKSSPDQINLDFVLNYKQRFYVSNISMKLEDFMISDKSRNFRHLITENATTKLGPEVKDIEYEPGQTKSDYVRQLKATLDGIKNPINVQEMVEKHGPCPDFLIYDAKFERQFKNDGRLLEVIYHKSERCYRLTQLNGAEHNGLQNKSNYKPIYPSPGDLKSETSYWYEYDYFHRVTSAYWFEPSPSDPLMSGLLFELNPDGLIRIMEFNWFPYTNETYPLGSIKPGNPYEKSSKDFYQISEKLRPLPFDPFIKSQKCANLTEEFYNSTNFKNQTKDDFRPVKPFRAVFIHNGQALGFTTQKSFMKQMDPTSLQPNKEGWRKETPIPELDYIYGDRSKLQIEEVSILEEVWKVIDWHAVYRNRFTGKLFYSSKVTATKKPIEFSPDAIVHWPSCKKVVTFYGFLYTMHDYNQDIMTTPSKWQMLDERQFDYPIETAVVKDGHFLFFTQATTVIKMVPDTSDCSRLAFISSETLHLNQLFNSNINETELLLEGRFYNGTQWYNPPSDSIKHFSLPAPPPAPAPAPAPAPTPAPLPTVSKPLIWPYIVGGVVIGAIVLILMLFYLFRNTEQARE